MYSLIILSLLATVINTSWSVDLNNNESIFRNVPQNLNDHVWKNPAQAATVSHATNPFTFKQVDDRISDIVALNVLHFGHNLGLELAALDPYATRSEIFSPLSIMAALSLVTLGAKGRSYQELKHLLALGSDNELIENPSKYHEEFGLMLNDLQHTNVNGNGVNKRKNANWRFTQIKRAPIRGPSRDKGPVDHIIRVANGLFVQNDYTINPDYSQVLQSVYQSDIQQLDFQRRNRESRDYINAWVNKATFGKIPQIIEGDIEKSTNIILASALYFKAFWETSFFPKSTTEDYFYPDGKDQPPIQVQMMPTGGTFPFYDAKEYDCRIIGLPYKGNETTMYVIQPNNSSRQKLRELQMILNAHKINAMIDNMQQKTAVMIFPKMHFTRSLTLKTLLKNMNVRDIFVNGYSDLSLIGGRPNYSGVPAAVPAPLPPLPPPPSTAAQAEFLESQFAPSRVSPGVVTFESINRKMPDYPKPVNSPGVVTFESNNQKIQDYQKPLTLDRFNEPGLLFSSRFGGLHELSNNTMPDAANKREKRQVSAPYSDPATVALRNLEANRLINDAYRSDLYVDNIIHKVDFSVDEQGTEAAAATLTYLHRSGTDVTFRGDAPFLIVIRHDPTKLPLFYGIINKPEL